MLSAKIAQQIVNLGRAVDRCCQHVPIFCVRQAEALDQWLVSFEEALIEDFDDNGGLTKVIAERA